MDCLLNQIQKQEQNVISFPLHVWWLSQTRLVLVVWYQMVGFEVIWIESASFIANRSQLQGIGLVAMHTHKGFEHLFFFEQTLCILFELFDRHPTDIF